MSIYPGSIFLDNKKFDERLEILGYKNSNTLSVISSLKGQIKMTPKEILNNYVLLKPDMIFSFNIVNLNSTNLQDVIVTMFINKEGETEPYCICRQCITDIFANQLVKDNKEYYGVSVSRDTCPTNVDFSIMLTCNGIVESAFVAGYIGITNLDKLISYIKTSKYDAILYKNFEDHVRYYTNKNNISMLYKSYMKDNTCNGYCKTIKDLLLYNNFMFDVYKGLNIIPIEFNNLEELSVHGDSLSIEDMSYLSYLIRKNIIRTYVIKYDKTIDLKRISKNYVMIVNRKDDVYIILYDHYGEYTVPINESPENITTMNNVMSKAGKYDSNIIKAYDKLIFNQNKYK